MVKNEESKYKIRYSDFYDQYYVLKPKGNGYSEMYRFNTKEEAEHFIEECKSKPLMWWQK